MPGKILLPAAAVCLCMLSVPAPGLGQTLPRPIDPCALLTTEEVSAAMGQTVEPGRYTDVGLTPDGAYSTTCLWQVPLPAGTAADPNRSLGGRSFAILNVMNWGGKAEGPQSFLRGFHTAFERQEIGSRPVPVHVGADEALWWGDGVAARKDEVSFGMSVASPDRATRQPRAEQLAKLIARRLGRKPG